MGFFIACDNKLYVYHCKIDFCKIDRHRVNRYDGDGLAMSRCGRCTTSTCGSDEYISDELKDK